MQSDIDKIYKSNNTKWSILRIIHL